MCGNIIILVFATGILRTCNFNFLYLSLLRSVLRSILFEREKCGGGKGRFLQLDQIWRDKLVLVA